MDTKWTFLDNSKIKPLCRCECGTVRNVNYYDIKNGKSKSCGCHRRVVNSEYMQKHNPNRLKHGQSRINELYGSYITSAKLRGYSFDLQKDKFEEIIKSNCFYCGKKPIRQHKPTRKKMHGDLLFNGIDRLDNTIGYINDNVVAACSFCNNQKHSKSLEEYFEYLLKVGAR